MRGLGARDRERLAVDHDRGVRDDQRLADRAQRQCAGRRRSAGHLRRGAQGVRALAEQQLVDDAAQDHAGRLVGGRRQCCEQRQRAGVELAGAQRVEQGELEDEDRHHRDQGDGCDHRGDHESPDVDQVGQRGADVHRGPDQGEHRDRKRRHGSTGEVLGGEGGEEVQETGHHEGEGHPDEGPALALRGDLDPPPRVDQERAALHQRHQPVHVRAGVRDPDGATAEDDHQADEVDGVSPAEPWKGGERGRGEHRHRERTRQRAEVVVPRGQQHRGRDGGAPGEDEEGGGDQRPSAQQESHARRGGGHRDDRQGQVEGVHDASRPGRARGPGSPPRSGHPPRAWRRSW